MNKQYDEMQREELRALGDNIKKLRQSINLSQEEFSDLAGLHRTYISQLEMGLRNPTYLTLEKISKALHCTVAELFEVDNA